MPKHLVQVVALVFHHLMLPTKAGPILVFLQMWKQILPTTFLVATALRYENYSDFGSNLSGKLASRYKIGKNFAIRGSINKGFRAPSLQQLFNSQTTSTVQSGAIRQTQQLEVMIHGLHKLVLIIPNRKHRGIIIWV
ncbi:MAG: TonB-dependent receptor [Chitinophagaceae bacterium]